MNVLMVASEAVPLLATSGVANVVSELTLQLRKMGHDVRIAIPHYRTLTHAAGAAVLIDRLEVPMGTMLTPCTVSKIDFEHAPERVVPTYLIGHPFYFDRETPYGYADDYERFICFGRAVLEMLRHDQFQPERWTPDVIHGHDWIAGLIPSWLRYVYAGDDRLQEMAFAYTIHNASFPGRCSSRSIRLAGLGSLGVYLDVGETPSTIDFMTRGVLHADTVNTVSPTHAQELSSGALSTSIDKALLARPDAFSGILNGADDTIFSPRWDPALSRRFDEAHLDWRASNRTALQQRCGLDENRDVPIFAIVTRLIEEKGVGLLEGAMPTLLEARQAQFVVLGQPGDHHFREALSALRAKYSGLYAKFGYDEALARCIYAGCDVLMVPSLYEPCGLQQLLAMRYGAIPLVRRTGGLADTVRPWDAPAQAPGRGFVFDDFSVDSLRASMGEAIELFKKDRARWTEIQTDNMLQDFTWRTPAREYLTLYSAARLARTGRPSVPPGAIAAPDDSDLLVQTLLAVNELMTTAEPAGYLHHVAEETRELLRSDAVLIWTVDNRAPHQLTLAAASPAAVFAPDVHSDHSTRTWSRQYAYRIGERDGVVSSGLRAQRGFLSSDMAVNRGWKTQISSPIGARGLLLGRIDAFSNDPERSYADWHFTALTAIANAVGTSLERRHVRSRRASLLKLDRNLSSAKTIREIVGLVLAVTLESTSADRADLDVAGGLGHFTHEGGGLKDRMEQAALPESDSIHARLVEEGGGPELGTIRAYRRGQPFLPWHAEALEEICRQASGTIAAAIRRERDENARIAQLRDLAQSLVGGGDEDEFLQRIIEKTADALQSEAASLYTVYEDGQRLRIRAATGYLKPLLSHKQTIQYRKGEGITGWIWQSGEKVKADSRRELHSDRWQGKYTEFQGGVEPTAFMGLPLKVVDPFTGEPRVIGVLKFEDRRKSEKRQATFTDQDLLLAEMMANIIAAAVHNAAISGAQFMKLSRDLGELSETLVAGQDIQGLLQGVVVKMAGTLNAKASSLYLFNKAKGLLEIKAATGYQEPLLKPGNTVMYERGEGITGWIFDRGEVVRAASLAQLRQHPAHLGKQNSRQNNREPDTFLGLPLTVTDRFTKSRRVIGVLKVEEIQPTPAHPQTFFTEQDERLVVMMASVIATVVYNTQVSEAGFAKLSGDLEKLSNVLSGGREMNRLVEDVVDTTAKTLGAGASSLYLHDAATGKLKIHAATGYQQLLADRGREYDPGEGVTGAIFQTGVPFLANRREDLERHHSWKGKYDREQGKQPNTFLAVPLSVVDRYDGSRKTIGVLKIEEITASADHPEAEFTSQDVLLVKMMANVIATVVYNTQVGAEQLERFGSNLGELANALAGGLELKALVTQVVRTIARVLSAGASSLYLYDEATDTLLIMAATGYQETLVEKRATYAVGEGVTGSIFRSGRLFRANTPDELSRHPDWRGKQDQHQGGRQPDTFLGVPLNVAGATVGVLKIEDIRKSVDHPEAVFTDQDVRLVTMMANVIATVVFNAREGEKRIGGILERMGLVSRPVDVSRALLSESARSHDDGLLDQLAIATAAHLDSHPDEVETEACALHALPANPAVFARISGHAKDPEVKWRFSLYSCLITATPARKWDEISQAANYWLALREGAANAYGFKGAVSGLMSAFAARTQLLIEEEPSAPTWCAAVFNTEVVFAEGIERFPWFLLREPTLNETSFAGLLGARQSQWGGYRLIGLLVWGDAAPDHAIERLRYELNPFEQELVVATRDEFVRMMEAPEPAKAFQSLVYRSTRVRKPFVTGGPVPDRMFFGRDGEISQVIDEIRNHRSCIIIGGRTIGKTSILQRLKRQKLPEPPIRLRAIYHDCETTPTEESFYAAPLLSWSPSPPPDPPKNFQELLDHPLEDVVLLLDETDVWVERERQKGWPLFGRLRGLSHDRQLRLVMTGERAVLNAVARKEGPLGNFGTTIYLGLLERAAVRALVFQPFELMGVNLVNAEKIVEKIFNYSGGHPNLVQRVCLRLVDLMNKLRIRQLDPDLVNQVVESRDFLNDFLLVFWEPSQRFSALESVIMISALRDHSCLDPIVMRDRIQERLGGRIERADIEEAFDQLVKLRSVLSSDGRLRLTVPAMLQQLARERATDDDMERAWSRLREGLIEHN